MILECIKVKKIRHDVSRVLSWVVIYLGVTLPRRSSEVQMLIKQLTRLNTMHFLLREGFT